MLTISCMDDLHNYNDCVQIETARCEFRDRCDAGFDVAGCVTYYEEFCRTRKIKADFKETQVDDCLADIDALGSAEQCVRLDELGSKSEICVFSELASCREFLCIKDTEEDTGDADEDTDTGTDSVPDGLNPS